jgi:hypothetical protein
LAKSKQLWEGIIGGQRIRFQNCSQTLLYLDKYTVFIQSSLKPVCLATGFHMITESCCVGSSRSRTLRLWLFTGNLLHNLYNWTRRVNWRINWLYTPFSLISVNWQSDGGGASNYCTPGDY